MTTAYLRECLPKILASVWIQCFNFTLISVKHGFDIVTEENIVEAESFRIAYIRYDGSWYIYRIYQDFEGYPAGPKN